MRNCIFILLIFSLLFTGCTEQNTPAPTQRITAGYHNYPVGSAVETNREKDDVVLRVSEPNDILTLRDVLALTLMHNQELKVFSLETRAAQARKLQAGLWPNPQLEIEVVEAGGGGNRRGFDAAETSIVLSQLIEMGNKSQKRKKIASFQEQLAELDYQNKKLEVFAQATKAFILLLKAQEKLQLSNEILKLSERSFEIVEKKVSAGKDSPVEKIRASVALANVKIKHKQTQRNLKYARKRLTSFWAQTKPVFARAAGNLDRIEQLPPLQYLTEQLRSTPQYIRAETQIENSQAMLELEKAKAIGDITIGAGLQRFNETDDNAVVFGLSIPLQLSNRNQGAKLAAVHNLAKSRHAQRAAWLKLQNELNRSYQQLADSYTQATSLKNEVLPGATEMFDAATKAYRNGKVDYLNVLDAQRTLFDVKNQYIETLVAYHTARTDIERLIGENIQINVSESEE